MRYVVSARDRWLLRMAAEHRIVGNRERAITRYRYIVLSYPDAPIVVTGHVMRLVGHKLLEITYENSTRASVGITYRGRDML